MDECDGGLTITALDFDDNHSLYPDPLDTIEAEFLASAVLEPRCACAGMDRNLLARLNA
jgi:hypothetical protein